MAFWSDKAPFKGPRLVRCFQKYRDTRTPGHRQKQLMQTLIVVCWKRTFLGRSLIVKSLQNRIELVTRPVVEVVYAALVMCGFGNIIIKWWSSALDLAETREEGCVYQLWEAKKLVKASCLSNHFFFILVYTSLAKTQQKQHCLKSQVVVHNPKSCTCAVRERKKPFHTISFSSWLSFSKHLPFSFDFHTLDIVGAAATFPHRLCRIHTEKCSLCKEKNSAAVCVYRSSSGSACHCCIRENIIKQWLWEKPSCMAEKKYTTTH